MKKLIVFFLFMQLTAALPAQQKIRFSTQNMVGLLVGGSDNAPQVQTINGLAYRNWFTGIGAGIDWYYQRSIPVFFSANRFFTTSPRRQVFLTSGAGINYPWGKPDYITNGWGYDTRFSPGFFWMAGLGYKIGVGKQNDNLLIQLGYNNKAHSQKTTTVYPCLVPPCPQSTEKYQYSFNALSLKLGWGF